MDLLLGGLSMTFLRFAATERKKKKRKIDYLGTSFKRLS